MASRGVPDGVRAIALAGPTASGKTAAALAIAREHDAEIVSVDSALVYRGMDIGTAKPSTAERDAVAHHLIDIRDPSQAYNAAEFSTDAHRLVHGMKSYNGVAIISRIPFTGTAIHHRCGKEDCRHVRAWLDTGNDPVVLDNLYIPAGGDVPDPDENVKFAHKLQFLDEMTGYFHTRRTKKKSIMVGDLNVAPLEHDVWSHKQLLKVVSHTPIEVEKLGAIRSAGKWVDAVRHFTPESEKLFSWWSYRSPDWTRNDRGRRLDHIWVTEDLKRELKSARIRRDMRAWKQASDHVPVILDF